jgi:hypothetical protein
MWAVWFVSADGRLHIGSLGCFRVLDDMGVSFTVCLVSVFREGSEARQTMTFGFGSLLVPGSMCRGSSVKNGFRIVST